MGYLPDAVVAEMRTSIKIGYYIQLVMDDPADSMRVWSGIGDIMQTLPGVDATAQRYYGGKVLSLEQFEIILQGGAERKQIILNGVSQEAFDAITGVSHDVTGKLVYVGFALHDAKWQPKSAIYPLALGIADSWSMRQNRVTGSDLTERALSLGVGFGETGRTRPRRVAYSDSQQQLIHPGDTFCQDTPRYHQGYIVTWPRF